MKSACETWEAVLSGWLDGELDPASHLETLDHLTRCEGCRRFYREARALDGLAAGLRPPGSGEPAPEEIWERIHAAAAASEASAPRVKVPGWAWRAAAALVVAAGLAVALWKPMPPPAGAGAEIEVVLGENAEAMTEARFVEITTEVLRADRRFHREMFQVMEQVVTDTGEIGEGEAGGAESRRRGELESETEAGGERVDRELA